MLSRLRVGVPVVVALLLAAGWLVGQTRSPDEPPPRMKGVLPPNFKKLGLTDEQTREIYKIRGTYAAKVEALKQQIRDLHTQEMGEIEKLLTEAQKLRLRELKLGEPTRPKEPDTKAEPDKKAVPDKKAEPDKKSDSDKK
jgi:hypothetical protein